MPIGVYERTEECKNNLSKSHLGNIPWNKGKKTGQIPWNKGKIGIYSEEVLERNRIVHLKENLNDETIEKKRLAMTGNKNPNYGKHRTEKTIEKIREKAKQRWQNPELKKKMRLANLGSNNPMYNKHCSKETKEKMSRAHKKLSHMLLSYFQKGSIPWNKDKKGCFTKEILKRILYRRAPSSLEEKFQSIVDKYNLPYKYVGDGSFIIGRYNPDFINTNSEKIAIEVYARYYKKRNNISIEDWKIKRSNIFRQYGWQIMYFNEIEVNEENILNKLNEVK